jgi:hypothetical protein
MNRKTFIVIFDKRSFGICLKSFISPNFTPWLRSYVVDPACPAAECGFCGAARSSTDGDHSRSAAIQQFELCHIVSVASEISH